MRAQFFIILYRNIIINSFRIYITDTGRKLLIVLLLIFDGMVAGKPAIANKKVAKTIPRIIVDSS